MRRLVTQVALFLWVCASLVAHAQVLAPETVVIPAPLAPAERGSTVLLRAQVDAEGQVTQLEVYSSSGSERLDKAALDAVARWTFVPARQGGKAVASVVRIPISFSLKE